MKTPAILILSVLCRTVLVSTKTVKHTVEEWNRYRNECLLRMSTDLTPPGLFCGRMFDMYACWPEGVPNTTVKVPCPWYLPWYNQGTGVALFVMGMCCGSVDLMASGPLTTPVAHGGTTPSATQTTTSRWHRRTRW